MKSCEPSLPALVAAELAEPVNPLVELMAKALADQYPGAARAVLFYGSCLRQQQLEGLMLDFYLIVSDYRSAYRKRWLAAANRLIPPNVFPFAHEGLAAKYAVLSEADFARLNSMKADNVSVWARFAQPSRLVWVAEEAARSSVIEAVSQAAPTLFRLAAPAVRSSVGEGLAYWRTGFDLTYNAELRAERKGRSASIIDADEERYRRFTTPVQKAANLAPEQSYTESEIAANARLWRRLQRRGKRLTLLRLAKASLTFAGGIDYLAWKINRHAGTDIRIKPWQRRWPLLGAVSLLPRLWSRGAVR
ncbi:hypothetical protein [Rhizorhapis suberifaciens]|uniref:Phosphatidate cytidylyltransferase n=1 Tax=Rhizorhapis suberifaciens TaxID=13656 RepID=A0A840HSF6_9SPHN|nr:hypothetical protein [Rhizorhapis suberifaciens]MBB4640557.1 hypothetical protein [Rhizorhapis suberifaciens]